MHYRILIPRPVQKQLDDLPKAVLERVLQRLVALQQEPRPRGCIKLKGYQFEYRLRVGDYRLRYEIRDAESVIVLLHCKHRKDVYRE